MKEKKILFIILFNVVIIISEILFGLISNSFALIADALHNTGDVIAIVITYVALRFGTTRPTYRYTFGFIKAEMMAAFTNSLFLILTMIYMIYESVMRVFEPQTIEAEYMIVVGFIAVIANGISAYLLYTLNVPHHHHDHDHHHDHNDANITSAYLHMLADTLISSGVVAAGIAIYFFKIYTIDSILTIIFSIYIIKHSYPLLRRSFLSLMDANVIDISEERLAKIILSNPHTISYHDLHIYRPSSKHDFISFQLVLDNKEITVQKSEQITSSIKKELKSLGFDHILIEVNSNNQGCEGTQCTMAYK